MHSRAVDFGAGVECAPVRIEAFERRQQRGVDVEQAAGPLVDEPGREQPHEAGKANDLDAMLLQHALQRALESGAVFSELRVIDDLGGDAGGARGR